MASLPPVHQAFGPKQGNRILSNIFWIPYLIWEFTESNVPTFVIPNTAFGILGALSASRLAEGELPTLLEISLRLPLVIAFNWYNVFNFDLANQRLPESVQEDLINKPWRPIPTGKVTSEQARRAMLITVPLALALNYIQGVGMEGVFIHILTWLYNDLKGCDELIRDPIIAVAYGLFNAASLKIALGSQASISQDGYTWVYIISGVILTTMQVQDLKDQEGDRTRGRKTIPLYFGDNVSRVSIAAFAIFWSFICSHFWCLQLWAYALPLSVAIVLALSTLLRRTPKEDSQSWKLWCLWTVSLYSLPIVANVCGNLKALDGTR
jgi:4-hydroxybenzoate polyprenyltransferase